MPEERQEMISVGYKPIAIGGINTGYYHKYLVYTKLNGNVEEERVIHGGPESSPRPGDLTFNTRLLGCVIW